MFKRVFGSCLIVCVVANASVAGWWGTASICDPRPLGGHSCPASCMAGFSCAPSGDGWSCLITAGSVPGFCKAAVTGSCIQRTNACPGLCAVGTAPCYCWPSSSGGLGPC